MRAVTYLALYGSDAQPSKGALMRGKQYWCNVDQLPSNAGDGWAVWHKGKVRSLDLTGVTSVAERWQPASDILIAEPGGKYFLPPVCIAHLQKVILRTIARRTWNIIIPFMVLALAVLSIGIVKSSPKVMLLGALIVLFAAIFALDYYVGLRHHRTLAERAMYFHWLNKKGSPARHGLVLWTSFILLMAIGQVLLQQFLGGMTSTFRAIGVIYPVVHDGEYWRLLTGPYLHYSLMHFFTNASLLLLIGPMALASVGRASIIVFFIGNVVSAVIQMLIGASDYDNFGGISGGVYSLFGMIVMAGTLKRKLLPAGIPLLYGGLASIGIISSELLDENSATVAHVFGFSFGLVSGSICALYHRSSKHFL
ncbi:MAG: rhomboid family intramembrane serine protease [Pseudomonadota bacterium]